MKNITLQFAAREGLRQRIGDSPNSNIRYIPGVCNIGPKEIQRRKRTMIFSFLFMMALASVLYFFDVGKIWRLAISIPAIAFAISFQQWRSKFCIAFGIMGVFNFEEIGTYHSIVDDKAREKDRARALQIILFGIFLGIGLAIGVYFIP